MEAAVEPEGLKRRYGSREALRGISFRVGRGEVFGILGPNGGGKTTLFRILSTLIPPSEGTARIRGLDVSREPDAVRARLGVVFQSPSLDRHLTVEENLLHQGGLYGLHGAGLRRRADTLLERFSLADRRRERAGVLSGGLKRRVEIAKCLLHAPEVLLLDEPSTGLDPGVRRDLGDLLETLARRDGVTVLLTTHVLEEADRCDRLVLVDEGRIVAEGTPESLRNSVGGEVVSVGARDPESLAELVRERFGREVSLVDGRLRIETPEGHRIVPPLFEAFPGRIQSVTVGRPTLEDVFVHFTGRKLGSGEAA